MSFWSFASGPPRRLFLGLVDTSAGTWGRSAVIGAFCFFSLLTRACMFMLLFALAVSSIGYGVPTFLVALGLFPAAVLAGSLVLNTLLLSPMLSWRVFPAACISIWVNVPWAARRPGSAADSTYARYGSFWPAAVMELLYSGVTAALAFIAPTFAPVDPCRVRLPRDDKVKYQRYESTPLYRLVAYGMPIGAAAAALVF